MPFYYHDGNGKCCWCNKGEPTRQAWDWMICEECFRELEEDLHQDYLKKGGGREADKEEPDG